MELLAVVYVACGLFIMLAFGVTFLKVLSSLCESFAETSFFEKMGMLAALIWFVINDITWSPCHATSF